MLSLLYGPTLASIQDYWKTIALTIWTFVIKMMSWLFKTLCWFDIDILPRSKHFLILWLQSLSTLILEPMKMKSDTVSIFSPSICHEVMGKQWKQWLTLFFWAPKITADSDYSHEIKRCLLLGKKAMTILHSMLKNRDITLQTNI